HGDGGRLVQDAQPLARIDRIAYYDVVEVPVSFQLPSIDASRQRLTLTLRLLEGDREIGRTEDPIEIFGAFQPPRAAAPHAVFISAGAELERFVEQTNMFERTTRGADRAPDRRSVVLVGPGAAPELLAPGGWLHTWIENGGT